MIRRKCKNIHGLHLTNGIWYTDDEILKEKAHKFIQMPTNNFINLQMMQASIDEKEVFDDLSHMQAYNYKSPGPNRELMTIYYGLRLT